MKRFREGCFSIFQGVEYRTLAKSNGDWELIYSSAQEGFIPCGLNSYCLSIIPSQVESAYRVTTWAKYKGYDFGIFGYKEENNTAALVADLSISNYTLDLLFGQHRVSPHETFAPWVKIDDLEEIWEVRSPIEGFKYVGPEKVYLKKQRL